MTWGPRMALWLLIAALHLLLLALLTPTSRKPLTATRDAIELKLLPLPRPRKPPLAKEEAAPSTRREARTAPTPAQATPPSPPIAEPEPEPAAVADAPPAAAPVHTPSLLNSEGTRRAIHLATRTPLLSERAASASDAPMRETSQQRFGREVASTAHGNCLKGEFPGGGMGLLSLPFWIAAEAGGKCRK